MHCVSHSGQVLLEALGTKHFVTELHPPSCISVSLVVYSTRLRYLISPYLQDFCFYIKHAPLCQPPPPTIHENNSKQAADT